MKKPFVLALTLFSMGAFAQEHFAGINTSRRTGILNASLNPAELVNLQNQYEVNILGISANVANNKITFGDIVGGSDFEDLIFAGNTPTNLRADVEIVGPGFAMKWNEWGFAITSAARVRADMVDVNPALGNAVTNGRVDNISQAYSILSDYNQKAMATSWGEIGLSAARTVYEDDDQKFSAGVTFKLLFPGSYANIGASNFTGTVTNNLGDVALTDASAELNFAYSGSLANGFTDNSNYTQFFAGGLNGFSTDIGFNYQWKSDENPDGYFVNAGLAFKNMGSMNFKDSNNEDNHYSLNIQGDEALNLNQFENVDDIEDIEDILLQSGYVTLQQNNRDFKVKLPAYFSAYADVNVYNDFYSTVYVQRKLNKDNNNNQIAIQNILTITPRYSGRIFEAFLPLSFNEVSDFTAGIGFRISGFYLGSGSILSAALGDTNQADAYIGYRVGF
jgi:hypothetical protein